MNVLITGADRGLGFSLTKEMLQRGYTVFAGQFLSEWPELNELSKKHSDTLRIIPLDVGTDESVKKAVELVSATTDKLDVLIGNAGVVGQHEHDELTNTEMMAQVYNVNAIGNVRIVERFLSLLKNGTTRKICFVSSEASSITHCERDSFHWYGMTKAALNRYAKVLFNRYRKEDFKFRLYHPGWIMSYMGGTLAEKGDYTADEAASFAMDYFFDKQVNEDELVLYTYDGKVMDW